MAAPMGAARMTERISCCRMDGALSRMGEGMKMDSGSRQNLKEQPAGIDSTQRLALAPAPPQEGATLRAFPDRPWSLPAPQACGAKPRHLRKVSSMTEDGMSASQSLRVRANASPIEWLGSPPFLALDRNAADLPCQRGLPRRRQRHAVPAGYFGEVQFNGRTEWGRFAQAGYQS
jgi:hypothetical protein